MSNTDNYGWSQKTCVTCLNKSKSSKSGVCAACNAEASAQDRFPRYEEE